MTDPFETTEEEKKLIEEIWSLKQQVRRLKEDRFFLKKEKAGHNRVSHTEVVPAVVFSLLCLFNIALFVLEILIGNGTLSFKEEPLFDKDAVFLLAMSVSFTVGTPALAVFFGVMAFLNIRKLIYQTSNISSVKEKAQELGFTNFHDESQRIDTSFDSASEKLFRLEKLLKEKENALDVLQTTRQLEQRKRPKEGEKEPVKMEIVKHEGKFRTGQREEQ